MTTNAAPEIKLEQIMVVEPYLSSSTIWSMRNLFSTFEELSEVDKIEVGEYVGSIKSDIDGSKDSLLDG